MLSLLLTVILACAASETEQASGAAEPEKSPPNILLVVLDDVGLDLIASYGVRADAPPTPTIDALAAAGLRFEHAYATPWCSPSRAAMLTGRRGFRYGIGRAIVLNREQEVSLPLSEVTLPELLDAASPWQWRHALIGKWHLTTLADGAVRGALDHGFQTHRGSVGNLLSDHSVVGRPQSYYDWEKVENGALRRSRQYATSETIDDALEFVSAGEEPWFLWLAFNAAHYPWEAPPAHLHSYGDLTNAKTSTLVRAMVEATDRELGRLLGGMDPAVRERTLVIVVGDNGSSQHAYTGTWAGTSGKGTVYERGVRVPLIVAGPGVATGTSDALVHIADVFATIADLAGVPESARPAELDSTSLVAYLADPRLPSLRDSVQVESFKPNGAGPYRLHHRMVRDARYKLVRRLRKADQLYDLVADPWEARNLLEGDRVAPEIRAIHEKLGALLDAPQVKR